jgi:hypothetical protein
MAKRPAAISAPKHLQKESAAFFSNFMSGYILDEHHVRTFETALSTHNGS